MTKNNGFAGIAIIIILSMVIIVGGVGGYFLTRDSKPQTNDQEVDISQQDKETTDFSEPTPSRPASTPTPESPVVVNLPASNTSTPSPLQQDTCDPKIAEKNKFFGCIYSGKNFNTFKAELRPYGGFGVTSNNSVTPSSLGSVSAYKTTGGDIKMGYVTQPDGITLNGDFSIKLKGEFAFAPGSYTFYTYAGRLDGIRVKFNGVTKIDQWNKRTYDDYFDETFTSKTDVIIEMEYYGNAKYSGFVHEYSMTEFGWRVPQVVKRNQFCIINYPKEDSQFGLKMEKIFDECASFIPKLENLWTVQPSLTPYVITFIDQPSAAYSSAGDQYRITLQRNKVKTQDLQLGVVVHELTHIIHRPGYGFKDSNYLRASWVGEGLAEYATYVLGYPMSSGATTLGCDGSYYKDGYRCAATFFSYVDKVYPGFISKISKIMRTDLLTNGTLSQPNEGGSMLLDAFVQHTGKSSEELWSQCLQSDCK